MTWQCDRIFPRLQHPGDRFHLHYCIRHYKINPNITDGRWTLCCASRGEKKDRTGTTTVFTLLSTMCEHVTVKALARADLYVWFCPGKPPACPGLVPWVPLDRPKVPYAIKDRRMDFNLLAFFIHFSQHFPMLHIINMEEMLSHKYRTFGVAISRQSGGLMFGWTKPTVQEELCYHLSVIVCGYLMWLRVGYNHLALETLNRFHRAPFGQRWRASSFFWRFFFF